MAASLYDNDALENWKRFGGNEPVIDSYVAATGSSDSLQVPKQRMAPEAPVGPTKSMIQAAPVAEPESVIDYGDANMGDYFKTKGEQLTASKPGEVSATYEGPEAHSTYWGGSLVGGSRTGVEDYGNWQKDRSQYTQALSKWQEEYAAWEKGKKAWDAMQPSEQPAQPAAEPAKPAPTAVQPYGPPSTQQQNLGQTPGASQPQNPYAVPGQRSAPQPGTGPVQKPDKTLGKVNSKYAGVL